MFTIKFQPQSLFRLCLSTISTNLQLSEQLFHILPIDILEIVFKRCLTNHNRLRIIKLQKNHHNNNNNNDTDQDDNDDDDERMKNL